MMTAEKYVKQINHQLQGKGKNGTTVSGVDCLV